jgi:hypothetical protein
MAMALSPFRGESEREQRERVERMKGQQQHGVHFPLVSLHRVKESIVHGIHVVALLCVRSAIGRDRLNWHRLI